MEQIKTHYKTLMHPDYIGAYALMQGDKNIELVVTITNVKREMITGADGKKEECTIAYLKDQKPMILNATNQKNITKALSSPFIEDWANKAITLYVAKVKAFGDTIDALRVKTDAPVIKLPEFTPENTKWAAVIKAVSEKTSTPEQQIAGIRKSFVLSTANEKLIKDAAV